MVPLTLQLLFLLAPTNEYEVPYADCTYKDNELVSFCLKPLLNFAEELKQQTGSVQFPVQSSETLRKLCKMYFKFKDCTSLVTCNSFLIKAIDASHGYMCGSGYELFERHSVCFAEAEINKEYVNCKTNADVAINSAQKVRLEEDKGKYFEELCSIMKSYLRCCRPIITSLCGSKAWQLVTSVTLDSLHVTMPDCDLHNDLS